MKNLNCIVFVLTALGGLVSRSPASPAAGDVDPTFSPGASVDGAIYSLTAQPDGKILIGGEFCLGELSKTLLPGAIAVKRKSLALFPSELRIVL